MKNIIVAILLVFSFLSSCKDVSKLKLHEEVPMKSEVSQAVASVNEAFSIEILDDEALEIINPKATIQVVASGFTWTEGPVWVEEGKFLLFSDIPNNKVFKLDENNELTTYLNPSGYTGEGTYGDEQGSNGLIINDEAELILLQHGDRRVAKMNASVSNPKSDFSTIIDSFNGKKFNSPNDGLFDRQGNFYFTDPPYGLPLKMDDPTKELDFQGVYCLLKSGKLLLIDKLSKPNGIALSNDENKLYVAVSDIEHAVWYEYTLTEPGKFDNKKVFYDVTSLIFDKKLVELPNGMKKDSMGYIYAIGPEGGVNLPDGLKVNSKGYIFATGPGGLWIFNDSAKVLARIYTGQLTSNCALSEDEKRLFITANEYILSVELK